MKPKKENILIQHYNGLFHVFIKQKTFWFFYKWIPLTYQEAENSAELPIAFNSINEAIKFVNEITE
jgi:hypothetical protein